MTKFGVCLACLILANSAFGQGFSRLGSQPAERSRAKKQNNSASYKLSNFHVVKDTSFLVAPISSVERHEFSSTSSRSSTSRSITNYVFFNTSNDTAIALLPNNDQLIVSLNEYSDAGENERSDHRSRGVVEPVSANDSVSTAKQQPTRWQIVELIEVDSNGDGKVNEQDQHSLGVADAGGSDFAVVVPNLGQIFSREIVDAKTLLVNHGTQLKQVATRIDLRLRKIISSKPLPNFGTQ